MNFEASSGSVKNLWQGRFVFIDAEHGCFLRFFAVKIASCAKIFSA